MEKFFMAAMGGADGLGNRSIAHLVKFFGSAKAAWSADVYDLIKSGIKRKPLDALLAFRVRYPDAPKNLVAYCERHKINLCSFSDEDYPPILKEIDTPPMFFYYRGKLEPLVQRIAIVGTRENTPYGQNVALELAEELASAGLTVVSGAARGIDSFAHRGALKTGRTVAVLGHGINFIPSHTKKKLLDQIIERGVVMSEFPPQLPPNTGTFPSRNRIIAGLCRGVIVVEAGKKSGALITSDYAVDNNRDVFAIPGQIYADMSKGCNNLIRKGATLIKSARDVLDEYNLIPQEKSAELIVLSDAAAKVFEIIPPDEFITDDEILMQVDEINPSEIPDIMLELDMKGCVEEDAGRYKRKSTGKIIGLSEVAAKIFEIIPSNEFITDDEILMQVDEINPSEIPDIMLELEMKGCVEEDAGRYKRKVGG